MNPHYTTWTRKELNILRNRYPTESDETIAMDMGRTPRAIAACAHRNGLSKSPAYTTRQKENRKDLVKGRTFHSQAIVRVGIAGWGMRV